MEKKLRVLVLGVIIVAIGLISARFVLNLLPNTHVWAVNIEIEAYESGEIEYGGKFIPRHSARVMFDLFNEGRSGDVVVTVFLYYEDPSEPYGMRKKEADTPKRQGIEIGHNRHRRITLGFNLLDLAPEIHSGRVSLDSLSTEICVRDMNGDLKVVGSYG